MKKRLLTAMVACLMMLSAFTLFACGKNEKPKDYSFTQLTSLTAEMKQNTEIFETSSVDGVLSPYNFKAFSSSEYQYLSFYNECFVIPMQFIERSYADLAKLKETSLNKAGKVAVEKLNKSVDVMNEDYQGVKSIANNLKVFPSDSGIIYQGALQQFQYECTNLIASAYDVALNIAAVEGSVFNLYQNLRTNELKTDDTRKLRDYFSLQIGKDYFTLLLDSMNSKIVTTSENLEFQNLMSSAKTGLSTFLATFVSKDVTELKNLQGEPTQIIGEYDNKAVSELLAKQTDLEQEHKILSKCFDKFSLYDFYVRYNCNIKSYENDMQYASIYFDYIQNYYNTFINLQIAYYRALLLK